MRLFAGVAFDETTKDSLAQLTTELQRQARRGNFVPRENMHLTLAFIGETQRLDASKEALGRAVVEYAKTAPYDGTIDFSLELQGIGSFKQKRGHTWWVGLADTPGLIALKTLQTAVVTALRDEGFVLENRSYKPHITLARSVQTTDLVALEVPQIEVPVHELCLFSSRAVNGSQEYTVIARFPL